MGNKVCSLINKNNAAYKCMYLVVVSVHYTANWAPYFQQYFHQTAVAPGCTDMWAFVLWVLISIIHFANRIYYKLIKYAFFKVNRLHYLCVFFFKLWIARGSGNTGMTLVCYILDSVRYFQKWANVNGSN